MMLLYQFATVAFIVSVTSLLFTESSCQKQQTVKAFVPENTRDNAQLDNAWHAGSSTNYCIRRNYCRPGTIHKSKNCCFNPICRSMPGVQARCQGMSGRIF